MLKAKCMAVTPGRMTVQPDTCAAAGPATGMDDGQAARPLYTVAVRALCEFTAKQGDLDLRFTPSPSAQEGIAGHALVASRRGEHHLSEVSVSGRHGLTVASNSIPSMLILPALMTGKLPPVTPVLPPPTRAWKSW